MATIVRRKNRDGSFSYKAVVRRGSESAKIATFKSRKSALQWSAVTENAILESRHFPQRQAEKHTLGETIARYNQEVLTWKTHNTIAVESPILRYWSKALGQCLLANVSTDGLYRAKFALSQQFASNTVRRYLSVLSHVFTMAERWEWCAQNPVKRVEKPSPHNRDRLLEVDELRKLIRACRESRSKYLYSTVVLALCTGARKREIEELQWSQVSIDKRVVRLIKTKSKKPRAVPLIKTAMTVLKALPRGSSPFIFAMASGAPIKDSWEGFKYACRRAGIEDFHFHDLRHNTASYLAMSGANLSDIKEILGHSSISTTQRYIHYLQPRHAVTMGALSALFDE